MRRYGTTFLVALAVSVGSIFAGLWQWDRHETRAQAIDQQRAGSGSSLATLEEALAQAEAGTALDWRRVQIEGIFVPASYTELRNRRVDGILSSQALAYVRTESGLTVLVNAGWVPRDEEFPRVPTTNVRLDIVLRGMEPDDGKRGDSATRITPAQIAPLEGLTSHYGVVVPCEECSDLGMATTPLPSLTFGSHLAYAFQWWVFAALAPVGAVLLVARDRSSNHSHPARPQARRRGELSDEEVEDAL